MNPKVADFPALIRWIAEKYHEGHVYPIHKKMGVSPAVVQLWATGGVKNPSLENLDRLCEVYRLDFDFVRGLLRPKKYASPIGGGSGEGRTTPLPNLAEILPLIRTWLRHWVRPLQQQEAWV